MQEHVLHIKLVNGLWVWDYQGEHRANNGRLDHQAKGLIIVNTGPLGEVAKDPTSLVPIRVTLDLNLCLKIHLLVMTLELTGHMTRSQVLLAISKFFFCGGADGSYTVRGRCK
jgi:hypothetical protein